MDDSTHDHHLTLTAKPDALAPLFPVLQEGVGLHTGVGCSLRELLCDELGLSADEVEERIQTLFLNGKPVDSVDRTTVRDGAVLALSAALPGLLGATLRKDGAYASLRQGITHSEGGVACEKGRGIVWIKVFNTLIRELAPKILGYGVVLPWRRLEARIRRGGHALTDGISALERDGIPLPPANLLTLEWPPNARVLLTVRPDSTPSS